MEPGRRLHDDLARLHELLAAMRMAARLDAMGMKKYRGLTRKKRSVVWTGRVRLDHDALGIPAGWKSHAGFL